METIAVNNEQDYWAKRNGNHLFQVALSLPPLPLSGSQISSCIPASSTCKPSPGRVDTEGNFPRPFADFAGASAVTRTGIYSRTSKCTFGGNIAKLVSEINSICIRNRFYTHRFYYKP